MKINCSTPADERADTYDEATVIFRNFANAPKKIKSAQT